MDCRNYRQIVAIVIHFICGYKGLRRQSRDNFVTILLRVGVSTCRVIAAELLQQLFLVGTKKCQFAAKTENLEYNCRRRRSRTVTGLPFAAVCDSLRQFGNNARFELRH